MGRYQKSRSAGGTRYPSCRGPVLSFMETGTTARAPQRVPLALSTGAKLLIFVEVARGKVRPCSAVETESPDCLSRKKDPG